MGNKAIKQQKNKKQKKKANWTRCAATVSI